MKNLRHRTAWLSPIHNTLPPTKHQFISIKSVSAPSMPFASYSSWFSLIFRLNRRALFVPHDAIVIPMRSMCLCWKPLVLVSLSSLLTSFHFDYVHFISFEILKSWRNATNWNDDAVWFIFLFFSTSRLNFDSFQIHVAPSGLIFRWVA